MTVLLEFNNVMNCSDVYDWNWERCC